MPPTRRARSPAPPPYATKGWLSRCRRSTRGRNTGTAAVADDGTLAVLPDDLLLGSIFSRVFSDATDIARCAAACRRWCRVIATHGATSNICRSLPPPHRLIPPLALGFFHGGTGTDTDTDRRRRLKLKASSQPSPWFVPMASATRLFGSPFPGIVLGGGSLFHHARPVASRNGLVVVELWNAGARRAGAEGGGVALGVCNPMTGDVALVPPLAGPGHDYACALFTADDLLLLDEDDQHPSPRQPPGRLFFSLVLVYNRRGFTALRCFSSSDGRWGPEARKPGTKMQGHTLRHLGQATVLAGAAYWPMYLGALGVRLDVAGAAVVDVFTVPYRAPNAMPGYRLLCTTPDGNGRRLTFVGLAVRKDIYRFEVETLDMDLRSVDEGTISTAASRWEEPEYINLHHIKVSTATPVKMRWICDNSGTLFFTVGERASTSGAFAFNLETRAFEKLADGAECNSWNNFCGYEMDHNALIPSITTRFA